MTYGIVYEIVCSVTGLRYVGQTTLELRKRWNGHCQAARTGVLWELPKAIREHGKDNFQLRVLCECESKNELDERERQFICDLDTVWPRGYNMTNGGEGPCELTRQLISKRVKEVFSKMSNDVREQQKQRQRDAMKGRVVSIETREKISKAQKGKRHIVHSPETLQIISEKNRGQKRTLETKHKISASLFGRKLSDDHVEKIRQRMKIQNAGKTLTDETKKKIGDANRKITNEIKEKICEELKLGKTLVEVAKMFCVSRSTVIRIRDENDDK